MIINKTLVSFAGRTPSPRYVPVGVVGDNLVECVEFRLPTIDADQTATMMLKCKYADAVSLTRTDTGTYCADITAQIAGESGRLEAYIRIDGAGGAVWNSEPFMLCVCNVPDVSGDVEDREPGALERTLSAIAAHNAAMKQHGEDMEEATESASESAENAVAAANAAIGAAANAAETLNSIPEDYTELVREVGKLSKEIDNLKENGSGESGTGIPTEAKTLLIQILRRGAYNDDVSSMITALGVALNIVTPSEYVIEQGSVTMSTSAIVGCFLGMNNMQRVSLFAQSGVLPITDQSSNPIYRYPINIPKGATGAKLTLPSSSFIFGYFVVSIASEKYVKDVDSGWQTNVTYPRVIDMPAEYSDGSHYLFINIAYSSGAAITPDVIEGQVALEFVFE